MALLGPSLLPPAARQGGLYRELDVLDHLQQSAPAVVLAEMDFVALGEVEKRKLFVGMTRAQVALEVVVSGEAEGCFAGVLRV